jgi:hypothetical protein
MCESGVMPHEGPLLTTMIVRDGEDWMTWWVDIPFFGRGGAFQTLDWLAQATESLLGDSVGAFQSLDALLQAIDDLVVGRDPSGGGTLQYMIYPWGRPGVGDIRRLPIDVCLAVRGPSSETVPELRPCAGFYISGSPGDLRAIESVDRYEVRGSTVEDLVTQVPSLCGHGQHSFIWDRDVKSLRHTD